MNTHNCASNANCMNNDGTAGFTCECQEGFSGDGFQCTGRFKFVRIKKVGNPISLFVDLVVLLTLVKLGYFTLRDFLRQ